MSTGIAHNFWAPNAAPALCTVDYQGTCIPNQVQYDPPPPACARTTCGCGSLECSSVRFNSKGICPGYHCESLGGAPTRMDYLDYYGEIVQPWLQCRPNMTVDPSRNVCVHDFTKGPFRPWSWQESLPDFRPF